MKNIHPIFQLALVPFAPIVPAEVEPFKSGLPAVNDGDFTKEDLEAIDAQFAPSKQSDEEWYRARELDRLVSEGKLK